MLTRAPRLGASVQLTAVRLLLLFLTSSTPTAINCTKPGSVFFWLSWPKVFMENHYSFISVNSVSITVVAAGKISSRGKTATNC
ncbi:JM144 [macacine gammaherpesvirus 11]|uniref:JM144 n=2 Tax=macacine gammaherpesvirus 11 TaxID=2560570 RepID=G9JMX2_9GAMA|nr:JM144 [Macaca fuscata rhadinovirus]AAT00121.1 JM144 [Macaca fuscata rhadinovirus]AEW87669.1 JM144 [Macaca fuscata rhadinovirus]AEW87839.1 JM144 [Macaca fuscata rhadinovirus]